MRAWQPSDACSTHLNNSAVLAKPSRSALPGCCLQALCIALLLPVAAMGAKRLVSAEEVVEAVSTSLALDRDDAALAKQLAEMSPTERLDGQILAFLKAQGAGPVTMAALAALQNRSATLPSPAVPCMDQKSIPSAREQQEIFDKVSSYGSSYMRSLPDFLCNKQTRRYSNYVPGAQPSYGHWRHEDAFVETVRFVNGMEVDQSGKAVKRVATRAGQSISSGEFGGDMRLILAASSQASVSWNRWENYRRKRTAVLTYTIGAAHSKFQVGFGHDGAVESYKSPIRGLIYAEPETGTIVRITIEAFDLPPSFAVSESRTLIDYSRVAINNHWYNLPVQAALYMRTREQKDMNKIFFRDYRKFEAESIIEFTNSISGHKPDPK
jgi:hypothetical protein